MESIEFHEMTGKFGHWEVYIFRTKFLMAIYVWMFWIQSVLTDPDPHPHTKTRPITPSPLVKNQNKWQTGRQYGLVELFCKDKHQCAYLLLILLSIMAGFPSLHRTTLQSVHTQCDTREHASSSSSSVLIWSTYTWQSGYRTWWLPVLEWTWQWETPVNSADTVFLSIW